MNTSIKYFILSMLLLSGIVYLAGCSKDNTSVVGDWSYIKQNAITKTTNATLKDTTYYQQLGAIFSLSADGSYELLVPGLPTITGTYTQTGSKLTRVDPAAHVSITYNVLNVSSHAMTLQFNDTISTSPLTITDRINTYTR